MRLFLFIQIKFLLEKRIHKYDKYGIQSDRLLGEGGGVVMVRGLGVGGGETETVASLSKSRFKKSSSFGCEQAFKTSKTLAIRISNTSSSFTNNKMSWMPSSSKVEGTVKCCSQFSRQ